MTAFFQRLHARLGDFWWYSLLLFVALRCGDVINAVVGLWLVPKYVGQEELGAVLPLTQFATSVGAPMTILVTVFTKYLNKFKTQGEDGKVKSMIIWFIGIAVVLITLTSAAALAVLPHFFERIRVTSGSLATLIIASGLIATLTPVFSNALQGLKKFKTLTLINLLSAPIRLITMLVAMPIRALSGYLVGQTTPQIFTIVTSCISLRKHVSRNIKATPFWKSDGRDILRYTGLVSVWIGIGALCSPITFMVIRQRFPEVESSAYYMLSRFAELATFAGQTLLVILFPLASEATTKGKNSFKYLFYADLGSVVFGILMISILYFAGPFIFDLIPTCRPYAGYMTDLTLLAISMVIGLVWANFTTHEIARGNFWFLTYASPLTILQAVFLVCFTGYQYFDGILPAEIVYWMASLKIYTLRGFICAMITINVIRVICSYVHIFVLNRKKK